MADPKKTERKQLETVLRFSKAIEDSMFGPKSGQKDIAKLVQEYTFHSQDGLLKVKTAMLFDSGIMLGRMCVNRFGKILPNAGPADLYRFRAMGNMKPLLILSANMFSQWFDYNGVLIHPECPGVWADIYISMKQNPELARNGGAELFAKQTVCWGDQKYRIHGKFYAYKQLADGCVMISKDLKKVYKVLGIGQPVGDIFKRGTWPSLVQMTMLPFCGVISYDGVLMGIPFDLTDDLKKKLKKVYDDAVANDTIIERIKISKEDKIKFDRQLEIIGLDKPQGEAKQSEAPKRKAAPVKTYKKSVQRAMAKIKSARRTDDIWVFRRFGYSEDENPNHMVGIISGNCGMPVDMFQSKKLEPTFDEVVLKLAKAVGKAGGAPSGFAVDHKPIVKELKDMLEPLIVSYYPPPSASEQAMFSSGGPPGGMGGGMPDCGMQ